MLGSILGDIVGSHYEFMPYHEKDVVLFHPACSWTDDAVLTAVVAQVCSQIKKESISDESQIEKLFIEGFRKAVRDYPKLLWEKKFYDWAMGYQSNDSAGNCCLMRIAPIVLYFNDLETVQKIGRICTVVSHNHPDSLKAVEVLLEILHYLVSTVPDKDTLDSPINHLRKEGVREIAQRHNVVIDTVQSYHDVAGYWALARDTLPRALAGYLEGEEFERIMKNMRYIGSDTDTTATIAGSLVELTYSLDSQTIHNLYRYYDHKAFPIVKQICKAYIDNKNLFENLFSDAAQTKIHELVAHKAVDQTAQWDPLELPSDEEYYNLKPGFSWKKVFIKLFGRSPI